MTPWLAYIIFAIAVANLSMGMYRLINSRKRWSQTLIWAEYFGQTDPVSLNQEDYEELIDVIKEARTQNLSIVLLVITFGLLVALGHLLL